MDHVGNRPPGVTAYKRGCRCELCRQAKREASRNYVRPNNFRYNVVGDPSDLNVLGFQGLSVDQVDAMIDNILVLVRDGEGLAEAALAARREVLSQT